MSKTRPIAEATVQSVVVAMAILFLVSGAFYLYQGRSTVTLTDEWYLYDVALNRPWLAAALTKYAGHVYFFPTLIWLANIHWFHSSQQFLFLTGAALLLLGFGAALVLVWRDQTVSRTTKLAATLVLIVGNFWMARYRITALGALNCMCSLAVLSALMAILWLRKLRQPFQQSWPAWVLVLVSGTVSSFSFGTGLGVWPTLLLLGWGLGLSWRSLGLLLVAATTVALAYLRLPGNIASELAWTSVASPLSVAGNALVLLCRLLGVPFLYAGAAWNSQPVTTQSAASSLFSLVCGACGITATVLCTVIALIRRELGQSSLELAGLGNALFNLFAAVLIVAGRMVQPDSGLGGFSSPVQLVAAPRYLFWSSLFWSGLLLLLIQRAESKARLRWATLALTVAIPVLVFPEHLRSAASARHGSLNTQSAATSLINGVHDPQAKILWFNLDQVYSLARQFRDRRLDMFAKGLQDWIGRDEMSVVSRHQVLSLTGGLRVEAIVECDDGAPAARCAGRVVYDNDVLPDELVIVDPAGLVCGIARATRIRGPLQLRQRLLSFAPTDFVGYIRHYDPAVEYSARAVVGDSLSQDKVLVQAPRS